MCGRFTSARKRAELLEEFRIERDRVTESLEPDYNVAPTKRIYAVLDRAPRPSDRGPEGSGAGPVGGRPPTGDTAQGSEQPEVQPDDETVARELRVVRWGLVPFWAKEPSIGSRMINARAESVATKPSFRAAFARRRCLLPADGFYEWVGVTEQSKTRKQPYYIHRADGGVLAFAGLYELWRDKSLPDDHPNSWLWTAVIITTQAQDEIGQIHDRTPMLVEPALWGDWLDPANNDTSGLHALLTPAAATKLEAYQVGMEVNSVRNNGPALTRPLAPAEAGAGGTPGGGPGTGPRKKATGPEARHRHPGTAPLTLF